ncbi:MAG: phage late control D family protein [Desulfitobacteriaceae bacterium]
MDPNPGRGLVVANNQIIRFKNFTVEQNAFSAADSFEIVLPFFIRNSQSGDPILANGPTFQSILLTQDVVPVQVYVGYPRDPLHFSTSELTQVIDGYMDTARWDFNKTDGEIVTLNGRNAVGLMMDTKTSDKFPNLTASAIAETFAANHGLKAVVTPTSTLAGTYYNSNSAILSNDVSEWDILLFLAEQENFIVRAKAGQLMFGPYSVVTGYVDQDPIPYTWGKDVESLEFERSPHAAKDVVVKVITWDRSSKARIIETAKSTTQYAQKIHGQNGVRAAYTETYVIPGLTRQQAQRKAQAICYELSRLQVLGQLTTAGNIAMEIDRKVAIGGVGQGLTDSYYLTKVTHTYDINGGYANSSSFCNQYLNNSQGVA